ncbi:hypothetical protein QQ020_05180 [Fulvivirgaceae bacterium BMA12]|uniref:DoxX family protein n=1 Tax=Agaribacillus aureus TaxID=3051825 RepID=A0ABT8L5D0_9BACT|nr:hypothetical protein [Fulvivirgaceae bacterium BMA12]
MNSIIWILRIGVFGIFFGHGILALNINEKWLSYLGVVGFSESLGVKIMPLIGCLDIVVAVATLLKPWKPVLIWAIIWAFSTALVRPIAGESIWAFVERAGNWATPAALLWLTTNKEKFQEVG